MTTKTDAKPPRKRATKKAAAKPPTEVVDEQAAEVEQAEDPTPDTEQDLFGEPVGELSNEERNSRLKKAYSNATSRLREEQRNEFDRLYSEEAKKLGVVYTPKPTAEQKAKQELEDLLAKFPHLRDQLVNHTAEAVVNPAPAEVPDPA